MIPSSLILIFLIATFFAPKSGAMLFHVQGELWCRGEPYEGARVALMEYDLLDPDDLLGEERSAPDGHFEVQGHESELLEDPEPYLLIGHVCPQRGRSPKMGCHFVTRVPLPSHLEHIATPPINLDGKFNTEQSCEDDEDEDD